MNLFKYLDTMKELDSVVAMVGVGVLAAFLVVIILKMFTGLRRGTGRQLVHTILTVVSAGVAVVVSVILSNGIVGSLTSDTFQGLLTWIDGIAPGVGSSILDAIDKVPNREVIEYIVLLPAALFIIPILTTVMFIIINTLFKIVYVILIKVFRLKKAKRPPQRLGGAVLAAVEGILWMMILVLPITGALSLVDDVFETALESETVSEGELDEIYEEYLVPFTKNPAIDFLNVCGSSKISDAIATVKIDGNRVNLREEIVDVTHFVLVDVTTLLDADFKNLGENDKEAVVSVIDAFCDSEFMSSLMVGAVQTAASAIEDGTIPLEIGGDFEPVFHELIRFFRSVSHETLKADLYTIKDLYFAINDSGILTAMEDGQDIMELLQQKSQEGDDTITTIKNILQENPRTSGMVTALTKSLISTLIPEDAVLTDSNGNPILDANGEPIEISYDTVKNSVNEILTVTKDGKTEEEFKEELGSTLDTALRENEIELEEDVIDEITEHINNNYDEIYGAVGETTGGGELTDEQFNDILLSYYNQYMQQQQGGGDSNGGDSSDN